MYKLLVKELPQGVTLTCLMDCKTVATGLNLPFHRIPKSKNDSILAKATKDNLNNNINNIKNKDNNNNNSNSNNRQKMMEKFAKEYRNSVRKLNSTINEPLADVVLYNGCRDDEINRDPFILNSKPVGAMTFAFIMSLMNNPNQTYYKVLSSMRDHLDGQFVLLPQLSTGNRMDLNIPIQL